MTRLISLLAATLVVATSFIALSRTAVAHEDRTVGPYQFEVGWLNEPAYVGLLNSFELRVTDTRSDKPVEGLEKTLTVELQTGGLAPLPLTVTATFDTPGAYNGYVIPTSIGTYAFHIKGKVGTLDIDEKFESGPGRFGDVAATTAIQYPAKVPTGDDLVDRLNALQSSIDQTRILAGIALATAIILTFRVVLGRRPG